MDGRWTRIKDRKYEWPFPPWIHVEAGDVDQPLELVRRLDGDESHDILGDCDGLLGQEECKTARGDRKRLTRRELCLCAKVRRRFVEARRDVDLAADTQSQRIAIDLIGIGLVSQVGEVLLDCLAAPERHLASLFGRGDCKQRGFSNRDHMKPSCNSNW